VTKGIALFILNSVLDGSEWSVSCPAPWGKGFHFPMNKKIGWAIEQVWTLEKSLVPIMEIKT
jgi:hypothetical protein